MIQCLDKSYSTTRQVTTNEPVFKKKENKFKSVKYLPEDENRQGEGGLRKQGYYKINLPDKPLITIITVVYNGDQHLEESILSVINQSYENVEYIVIDGGSSDKTLDIIRKYENAIDYWVSEKDKGIYDAMNKGLDVMTGEWVNFMNADDSFENENVLESLLTPFTNNALGLIFGNIRFDTGKIFYSSLNIGTYLANTVHHQAAFYNKSIFASYRYNTEFKISADYDLNLKIYLNGLNYHVFDKCIASCREGGVSRIMLWQAYKETNAVRNQNITRGGFAYQLLYTVKFLMSVIKDVFYKPCANS